MPDEEGRFQTGGISWTDRATMGQLNSALSPTGTPTRNNFLHSINMVGARRALQFLSRPGVVVDFGCGAGRFLKLFESHGHTVVGVDITFTMLSEAHRLEPSSKALLMQNDGIAIPLVDQSVDLIFVCGVLRFSLFVPDPAYRDIAQEMFRVLKPGGKVVNLEMYVENEPDVFERDFFEVGFKQKDLRVLQRYDSRMEDMAQSARLPIWGVRSAARFGATLRYFLDDPREQVGGLRDYMFVWSKPRS